MEEVRVDVVIQLKVRQAGRWMTHDPVKWSGSRGPSSNGRETPIGLQGAATVTILWRLETRVLGVG